MSLESITIYDSLEKQVDAVLLLKASYVANNIIQNYYNLVISN